MIHAHEDRHGETEETCTICDRLFRNKTQFRKHMDKKHLNRGDFLCSICQYTAMSRESLKAHEASHLNEEHKCEECEYVSTNPRQLRDHVYYHHKLVKSFQCIYCPFKAKKRCAMDLHEATHSTTQNYMCDKCNFKTGRLDYLNRHKFLHMPPRYVCDLCDYKTHDSGNYSTHKRVKHGNVILSCDTCGYNTKSKRSLMQHQANNNH
jgi:KRAB domain-containing zinc finger protein